METSLFTILDPANQLRDLLFMPKIIYFCAFFAYEGFRNRATLTHAGMRKGVVAKVYAVIYLLVGLGNLWLFPSELKNFLSINSSDIKQALFFASPIPKTGFIFVGLAVFILVFAEALIRYVQKGRLCVNRSIRTP